MKKKAVRKNKPFQARQGDVLFTEDSNAKGTTKLKGRPVFAEGETTGHAHALDTDKADWWKSDGEQMVAPTAPATVVHEEHGPIPLKPGRTYRVRRQSEYSPEEIRRVAD